MLRNRKKNKRSQIISLFCFALAFIALGFALISSSLGMRGNTKIGQISYDVHFENLSELDSPMKVTSSAKINENDNTQINLEVELNKPGEYYDFEVDVRNGGTLDAVLDNIEIVNSNSNLVDISFYYGNTNNKVLLGDLFERKTAKRVRVRVQFLIDIELEDIPSEESMLNLKIALIFKQYDRYQFKNLNSIIASSYDALDNEKSKYVTTGTGIRFGYTSSDTNGRGLYLKASTKDDENPIYYYRGQIDNNNVLFGGKCWKIIRTTETGGIKLLYNGLPNDANSNGICANTGEDTHIGKVKFNEKYNNISYIGYMYSSHAANYVLYGKSRLTEGNIDTIPIEKDEYVNVQNDTTYPYTFDDNTKSWSSNMHDHSKNAIITFKVATAGDYYLNYNISSETAYDYANIFIDNVKVGFNIGGTGTNSIHLGNLTTSNVIQVKYLKNASNSTGTDNIVFNIGRVDPVGKDNRWIYGKYATYENGKYTIHDTIRGKTEDYMSNYHYSCLTTGTSCTKISYVFYVNLNATTNYYYQLSNGDMIDDFINEILPNDNSRNELDSAIKKHIDTWFASSDGLLDYVDSLEDTVWCNDRTISTLGGFDSNGGSVREYLYFNQGSKGITSPNLECINKYDRFTLKSSVDNNNPNLDGNQMLDYPVGLLTLDEHSLIGLGSTSFIRTTIPYYTMSPNYSYGYSYSVGITADGKWGGVSPAITTYSVRPSVSLKKSTLVISGTGASNDPYVVL